MEKLVLMLLLATSIIACSRTPEAVAYGKDACTHCKMTIMDRRFGAEIVTAKGKVFKFDSAECMLGYMGENPGQFNDADMYLVVDYNSQGAFLDARKCTYVHDANINSPMGGNLAAMSSDQRAKTFVGHGEGTLLSWNDLVK